MNKIILSVKPKWWRLIEQGKKTIELRRGVPVKEFNHILFYCSAPVKRLVGIAKVRQVEKLSDVGVGWWGWGKKNRDKHCVNSEDFEQYTPRYAIHLGSITVFTVSGTLIGVPQNFRYIDDDRYGFAVCNGLDLPIAWSGWGLDFGFGDENAMFYDD